MMKIGFSRSRKTILITGALGLFALLILTCFFLSGEELVWEGKINDEKVANFFTSAGFIVAIFSVVGLLLQIWKAEEDKHISVKPELLPKNSRIGFYTIFPKSEYPHPPYIEGLGDGAMFKRVRFSGRVQIQNGGLGLAKWVKYKWVYSKNDLLQFLGTMISQNTHKKKRLRN